MGAEIMESVVATRSSRDARQRRSRLGAESAGNYACKVTHVAVLGVTMYFLLLLNISRFGIVFYIPMSGLEVAGVVLGAFPLLISGIENWRDVAKVGGFFWQIRKEYTKCRRDIQFYEIQYKKNLQELLLPLIPDVDEVAKLIADPGGQKWCDKALQQRLEGRLHESYQLYQDTITEMNEVAEELRKELCYDEQNVQDKLLPPESRRRNSSRSSSPQPSAKPSRVSAAKGRLNYELFRTKFSFGERIRNELFDQLKECNERLEQLLSSSDRISALQNAIPGNTKQTSALESAFRRISKKSDLLFRALQKAWQCSCQQYHFANLRLEHRTLEEACFEIILLFVAPLGFGDTPWSCQHIRCGNMLGCSFPQKVVGAAKSSTLRHATKPLSQPAAAPPAPTLKQRRVDFAPAAASVPKIEVDSYADNNIQLCQVLKDKEGRNCMGIIGHENELYHVHSIGSERQSVGRASITLEHILSPIFEGYISRRQRYSIAMLVASSIGQLHCTPWLRTGLCKKDILFFPSSEDKSVIRYDEPFIRQDFLHDCDHQTFTDSFGIDRNFHSLGILLLELCFGSRLEDHRLRRTYPSTTDAATKYAFDVLTALEWSSSVRDEGGDDYAVAVKWCFTGTTNEVKNWRGEMIRNVVRPLERCMQHFQIAASG